MPIIQSAKKALRQNIRKKKSNLIVKNKMKSVSKDLNEFLDKFDKSSENIDESSKKEIYDKLSFAYKYIDKAAKKGIIKKNTAARKKSRLAKKINKIEEKKKSITTVDNI